MSYFRSINQAVTVSLGNTDTSNLAVNQTYTGTAESTLGVNAIQTNLKADQNCIIYVDQGPADGTWNITDDFNYYNGTGGTGFTTQAVDAYTRVRVKNVGTAPTTQKDLSMVLCPIAEPLPRALSDEGNLKVGVYEIEGAFDTKVTVSPMQELKQVSSVRLVGSTFADSTDTNFWTYTGTGTGSAAQSGGQLTLSTGATASSTMAVQSFRTARYVAGMCNYYRGQIQTPVQGGQCLRRWGAYDTTNGYFYQYDGTNVALMARKSGTDSTVANGSFNGIYGSAIASDTLCNTYEIYWTNKKAYYFVNNEMLHTLTSSTTTAVGTNSLSIRFDCINGTGNTSNNSLVVRVSSINRLGMLQTQPTSRYFSATTAGTVLKIGAGNLHSVVFGTVTTSGAVVTLYDGVSTGGTIIATFTIVFPAGGNFLPMSVDFKGLPFFTGLFIVIATQAALTTVIYE